MSDQRVCVCGCGETVSKNFKPGHDPGYYKTMAESLDSVALDEALHPVLNLLEESLVADSAVSDYQRNYALEHLKNVLAKYLSLSGTGH